MAKLKILTWNIWMMPSVVRQSPRNRERAAAIALELKQRDFDIVCFVKAFDAGAREILRNGLGERYPHRYGPVNSTGAPHLINGGVWVLSRLPLTLVREIRYRDYIQVWEGFSRKGAMLLSGYAEGKPFQLIGTHLQGESGAGDHNQAVRDRQITQLTRELVDRTDKHVPLFICGDFNTQRRDRADSVTDRPSYVRMLEYFGASNGAEHRITLDDRRDHNDLAGYDSGRQAELDYILVRPGDHIVMGQWERIIIRRQGWDGPDGRKDLAYRYAVSGQFEL